MKKLIHVITNDVSRQDVASLILAMGHSVIMAESPKESKEVTLQSDALLLNLGMPTEEKIEAMKQSLVGAKEKKIPVLFDPVGVGFTEYRLEVTKGLLSSFKPTILRCNASEALSLSGSTKRSLGVDSNPINPEEMLEALPLLSEVSEYLLITGETDLLKSTQGMDYVYGGSKVLKYLTGMGDVLNAYLLSKVLNEGLSGKVLLKALRRFKGISLEVQEETNNPFIFRRLFLEKLWEDHHA